MNEREIRAQAIKDTMECARQIVRSYGPTDLPQSVRDSLCEMMQHYETAAIEGLK
jgi:hypothetical protein